MPLKLSDNVFLSARDKPLRAFIARKSATKSFAKFIAIRAFFFSSAIASAVVIGADAFGYFEIKISQLEPGGVDEVKASGFVQLLNNVFDVGDKYTLGSQDYEPGTQFAVGVDLPTTTANLLAAIQSLSASVVTAALDPGDNTKILLTSALTGILGNATTQVVVDGATNNFAISGATLAGDHEAISWRSIARRCRDFNF